MGSVFLDNVDDYLAPSQACINPLFTSDRTPGDDKDRDEEQGGENKKDTGGGKAVKPRRMRVVRRKGSSGIGGSGGTSISSRQSSGIDSGEASTARVSAVDAMDIDDTSAAVEKILPSAGPKVGRKRPPIALTYQTQGNDDASGPMSEQAIAAVPKQKKATVSVADCLACSGCVTSAEAVMVQSHSIATLREFVATNNSSTNSSRKDLVFTISPASLADLIRHLYGGKEFPPPQEILGRLTTFLHVNFGAKIVIDGSLVQELSLIESAEEFCARYLATRDGDDSGTADANTDIDATGSDVSNGDFPLSTPSIALSATETRYLVQKDNCDGSKKSSTEGVAVKHDPGRDARLDRAHVMANSSPVVTSSCPGFVCYVEKTAPAVIPNLSTAKSPMACSGTLVKHIILSLQKKANDIYHVAIMPCHDKKLEAGRKDLAWETADVKDTIPDVDLVLTTSELFTLLSDATAAGSGSKAPGSISRPSVSDAMDVETEVRSADTVRSFLESISITRPSDGIAECFVVSDNAILLSPKRDSVSNSVIGQAIGQKESVRMIGSGAYAEFCFRYAARKLYGFDIPDEHPLPWQQVSSRGSVAAQDGVSSAPAPVRRRRAARGGSFAHSDMLEVVLYGLSNGTYSLQPQVLDGVQPRPLLKFATAYGFKNVQLVLMKLGKRGEVSGSGDKEHTPEYFDFIEVMACPSGCLNGGGQIRDDNEKSARRETPAETRERVGQNRAIMNSIGLRAIVDFLSKPSDVVSAAYAPLTPGPFGSEARKLLHTRFHVVPKLELSTGATAGVALDDTQW